MVTSFIQIFQLFYRFSLLSRPLLQGFTVLYMFSILNHTLLSLCSVITSGIVWLSLDYGRVLQVHFFTTVHSHSVHCTGIFFLVLWILPTLADTLGSFFAKNNCSPIIESNLHKYFNCHVSPSILYPSILSCYNFTSFYHITKCH